MLASSFEELSLGPNDDRAATRHFWLVKSLSIIFPGLFELNSMLRLKILNLCYNKDDGEGIQNTYNQNLIHE